MKNIGRKIEVLSNIAIIGVAIALGAIAIDRYFYSASAKPSDSSQTKIEAGMKMPASSIDWSKSERTLVMALSTTCRYCTDSVPFYQKLSEQKAGRSDVRMVAVMPQNLDEARQYLGENKVTVDDVVSGDAVASLVRGTPTLILVDKGGSVVESWSGKLPIEKETAVLNAFLK